MEEVRVATEGDLDELVRLAVLARDELGVERGGLMWQLLHGGAQRGVRALRPAGHRGETPRA